MFTYITANPVAIIFNRRDAGMYLLWSSARALMTWKALYTSMLPRRLLHWKVTCKCEKLHYIQLQCSVSMKYCLFQIAWKPPHMSVKNFLQPVFLWDVRVSIEHIFNFEFLFAIPVFSIGICAIRMCFCIVLLKYTSSGVEHMLLQNIYIHFSIHSAFQNMQAAHTLCTYAPPYHQRCCRLLNWTLMTRWKVSLLFSPEDTASVISNENDTFGLVWP